MSNKITKTNIVSNVIKEMPFRVPRSHCNNALNALIEILIEKLADGYPIRIQGVGKLIPYFKAGGREVRNLQTGEVMKMEDRMVVSFVSSSRKVVAARSEKPTLSLWDLITALSEHNTMKKNLRSNRGFYHAEHQLNKLAECTVRGLVAAFMESRESCATVEMRGFGTFKTSRVVSANCRNPRTGEVIDKEVAQTRSVFHEGKALKTALRG